MILIDIGGGTNLTADNALKEIVGPSTNTDPPLRNYYAEVSYGTEELDGRVFGPFQYAIGSCNTSGMPTAFRAMVDQMGGGMFNHYLWYIGIADVGLQLERPRRGGDARQPPRTIPGTTARRAAWCMIQEPGHNFGMQHSSSMDCGSVSFPTRPKATARTANTAIPTTRWAAAAAT